MATTIGARKGPPLAVGYGQREMYLGSDAIALAPLTDTISYLEDGDIAVVTHDGEAIFSMRRVNTCNACRPGLPVRRFSSKRASSDTSLPRRLTSGKRSLAKHLPNTSIAAAARSSCRTTHSELS